MATVSGLWNRFEFAAEWPLRIRTFIWAATGMFSAAAMALAFVGYFWAGSGEAAASHVIASLVSGALFGVASELKVAPSDL